MIFSERYKDLVNHIENGCIVDKMCGNVDWRTRHDLVYLLRTFNEPKDVPLDRYDKTKIYKSDAYSIAAHKFFYIRNRTPHVSRDEIDNLITAQSLGNIFDVVELLYIELSDTEKANYSKELNAFFDEKALPWRILDGKMIKIDSQQFECDLKVKTIEAMKELKDAEPKFQSAYTELITAMETLDKEDYQSVINNAGKSYESVLKVVLAADRGNADKLTNQYMDQFLSVPDTMTKSGFREKVMMSLPYIRNNSGADHGAGAKEVVISKSMAKLAINLAASLDTYLIEEYMSHQNITNE